MTTLIDHLSESYSDFISKKAQKPLLSKRVKMANFDDVVTKKIKGQNSSISESESMQHSPLTEDTQSKSCDAVEEHSIAIEDEHPLEQKPGTFSRVSSSPNFNHLETLTSKSEQENAELLSEALETLRMRFMAKDQAGFIQDTIMKLFLTQQPKIIPPFTGFNVLDKRDSKSIIKGEDQTDVTYGQVEFPLMSLSTPFNKSIEQTYLPKLTFADRKFSVSFTPSKTSSLTRVKSHNVVEQRKIEAKDSLAATRAGTQRSDSDSESTIKKTKREKKIDNFSYENITKKKNMKVTGGLNKQEFNEKLEAQLDFIDKPYAFSLKQKKSRAERQRTRWESAQDGKFSISDYFTQVLNAGVENSKKKIQVPIGSEYQADLSIIPFKRGKTERRKLNMIWDPSSHNHNELNNFLKNLKMCLKTDISQEGGINLFVKHSRNTILALSYVKNNKAKCLKELGL